MSGADDVVIRTFLTNHPRIQPLVDGRVEADGITWEWLQPPGGGFRGVSTQVADVFEYSLSGFLMSVADQGLDAHDWIALPVFLSRATDVVARLLARDDIHGWSDLRGRRVAVPDVGMTAAILVRLVLRELYGIDLAEVAWSNIRQPDEMHTDELGVQYTLPAHQVSQIARGADPVALVGRGEIDVALAGAVGELPPNVRPLVDAVELRELLTEFTAKTGVFPINHVVIVRKSLIESHPGLDLRLYELIEEAKRVACRDAIVHLDTALLFGDAARLDQERTFGSDPFPSGLAANEATLHALMDQLVLEGHLGERLHAADFLPDRLVET
jgi:4,5-dihydroxyphthalate decarboxylase